MISHTALFSQSTFTCNTFVLLDAPSTTMRVKVAAPCDLLPSSDEWQLHVSDGVVIFSLLSWVLVMCNTSMPSSMTVSCRTFILLQRQPWSKALSPLNLMGFNPLVLMTYPVREASSENSRGGCETPPIFLSNYSLQLIHYLFT